MRLHHCTRANYRRISVRHRMIGDGNDLFYQFSQDKYARQIKLLANKSKCDQCFLTAPYCICSKVCALFDSAVPLKAHVALFMHFKEWGRASNTGKIVRIGCPEQSSMRIFGTSSEEELLLEKLTTTPSLVLYPGPGSISISEYRNWYGSHNGNVTLCAIDSTWPQSHAMAKIIPAHIPRVNINEFISGPSQYLNRKQSKNPTKVSTIEAIAIALEALGETEAAIRPLYQALHLCVDTLLMQSGKPTAYDSTIQIDLSKVTDHSPYTLPKIRKPESCPMCLIQGDQHFRNCGTGSQPRPPSRLNIDGGDRDGVDAGMGVNMASCSLAELSCTHIPPMTPGTNKPFIRCWYCKSCTQYFHAADTQTPQEQDL